MIVGLVTLVSIAISKEPKRLPMSPPVAMLLALVVWMTITTVFFSLYPNEVTKTIAKYLYGASAFLFDGSDAMPAQVGAGSFWKELVSWISGQEDINTALKNIDQSWPSS